jgi:hypothetical protein
VKIAELEQQTILQVAEEYRQRGYQVDVHPYGESLPPFLSGFRPDIIARAPQESVVIEVKVGASKTSVAEPLKALADRVHRQPGWRLAVIFVDPDQPDRISEAPVRDVAALQAQVLRSEKLKNTGELDAAFLLLWSTLEAALRNAATQAGIPIQALPIVTLVRELYSAGEISRSAYDSILRLVMLRNEVAHGFAANVTEANFSELADTTRALLADLANPQADS